jgi:hypothetical protein
VLLEQTAELAVVVLEQPVVQVFWAEPQMVVLVGLLAVLVAVVVVVAVLWLLCGKEAL